MAYPTPSITVKWFGKDYHLLCLRMPTARQSSRLLATTMRGSNSRPRSNICVKFVVDDDEMVLFPDFIEDIQNLLNADLLYAPDVPQGNRSIYAICYELLRMRPLAISCAESFVVISCEKVDYDKSDWQDDCVRISVRLSFIMSERLIDATSILHYELETPPV
jgi:hypothetical protein